MKANISSRIMALLSDALEQPRGGYGSNNALQTVTTVRERLLLDASKTNQMFYATLAFIALLLLVMSYLLITNAHNPQAFLAISSASGVSLTGLLWFALRVSRDASQTSLLLVLVSTLPSDQALEALKAILKNQAPIPTDIKVNPGATL